MAIQVRELDPHFKYEVAERPGGENIKACFSCGVCTAGCPISEIDERYNPRKIIRMVILGMKKEVLSSDFIWLCSMCYTCYAHCPQNVKFTDVMGVLRDMAVEEGYVDPSFVQGVNEIDDFSRRMRHRMLMSVLARKSEPLIIEPDKLWSQMTA
jgi:heterodisulfide reductase subunit C